MIDTRRDLRTVKNDLILLRTIMGEAVKTDAWREGDFAALQIRIERIEHRLDIRTQLSTYPPPVFQGARGAIAPCAPSIFVTRAERDVMNGACGERLLPRP